MAESSLLRCVAANDADSARSALRPRESGRADAADALNDLAMSAWAAYPVPMLIVDSTAIVFRNPAAARLLESGDGLRVGLGDRLVARSPEQCRMLWNLLDAAFESRDGGAMLLPRTSARPLLLRATPLGRTGADARTTHVLLLIDDPGDCPTAVGAQPLARFYGLTDAETKVATAMLRGTPSKRIARDRNVSVATVHSQVRRILLKTQCASQRAFIAHFGWLQKT